MIYLLIFNSDFVINDVIDVVNIYILPLSTYLYLYIHTHKNIKVTKIDVN